MGPQIYHYVKFFLGRVGHTPLGTPCDCMVALCNTSNAAVPFVITAFLALWIVLINPCHHATKCEVLVQQP